MIKIILLIVFSIFIPFLWIVTIPYILFKAALFYIHASNNGESYYREALIWETGGLSGLGDKNLTKAAKLYSKACILGNANACYDLSEMYREGRGVIKDEKLADEFKERAFQLGYSHEEFDYSNVIGNDLLKMINNPNNYRK